jgi:site-specific DNA recombinase
LTTKPPGICSAVHGGAKRRVDITSDRVDIRICQRRLVELLAAHATSLSLERNEPDDDPANFVTLTVMARLQRVGREMKMLVENSDDQAIADPGLLRIVARAHDVQARLMENTELSVHTMASQERVSAAYIYRLLRLPSLAPDIVTAIIKGKNPPQLTAKRNPAHPGIGRGVLLASPIALPPGQYQDVMEMVLYLNPRDTCTDRRRHGRSRARRKPVRLE